MPEKEPLNILYLNIRSLRNKLNDLQDILLVNKKKQYIYINCGSEIKIQLSKIKFIELQSALA